MKAKRLTPKRRPKNRARRYGGSMRGGRSIQMALRNRSLKAVRALAEAAERVDADVERVSLPVADVAAIADIIEDAQDAAIAHARAEEPTVPHDVVAAMISGTHPVRAWRSYKKLTLRQLADLTDMPVSYLSEIETGKKPGTIAVFRSLARTLNADLDSLIPEDADA